jgi:hypothetical protein
MFGLGDPALEVANFLYLSQSEWVEADQETWLEHYLAHFDQAGLVQRIGIYQTILPLQSLCFLLNGLREFRNSSDSAAEQAENLTFLRATLAQTLRQAADKLQVAANNIDLMLRPLFD